MKRRNRLTPVWALTLVTALGLGVAGCTTYRGANEPAPRFYEVRGHRMHLMVEGAHGQPTIILAGGGGVNDPYANFLPLTSLLKERTTVAVYERPGYGLSTPASTPRDVDTVVAELDDLFIQAGLVAPYVLVGHSMASLEVLRYAQVHPDKVRAVVLVEGAPPRYYLTMTMPSDLEQSLYTLLFGLAPGNALEVKSLVSNARTVIAGGSLGALPLVTIQAGANGISGWSQAQEEFANYSTRHQALVVPQANHFLHRDHAPLVAQKVLELATEP